MSRFPKRIELPNGCSITPIAVTPANWNRLQTIKRPWRLHYRFYDPNRPRPIQVVDRSINEVRTIGARKQAVALTIADIMQRLRAGYNPFTKEIHTIEKRVSLPVEPDTPFIDALYVVVKRIELVEATRKDIIRIIRHMDSAARFLFFDHLTINEIRRKHIKLMLEHLQATRKRFTNNTYNHYRKYLTILFWELMELEAVDTNVVKDLKKKDHVSNIRELLTDDQDQYITDYLKEQHYTFYRYREIFKKSGARISELSKLQAKNVNLEHQRYTTLVLKGRKKRWVQRTIKTVVLPLWQELMQEVTNPEQYLFSKGLVPGLKPTRPDQITKRWYRLVQKERVKENGKWIYKDRLHLIDGKPTVITADFYAEKHREATKTVETEFNNLLEQARQTAATQMGHTSTKMVAKVYNINDAKLRHEIEKRAK